MECPNCRAAIRDEDDFCSKCGHALRKRVKPEMLEETRVKIWLNRVKSNRRWGLFCLVVGIFTIMLGFYTADMIVFMAMSVVKQPSIHWELVLLGGILAVVGYSLAVRADRLERKVEKGEMPSAQEDAMFP